MASETYPMEDAPKSPEFFIKSHDALIGMQA